MAIYFEGQDYYHRYDNCPEVIELRRIGKKPVFPLPKHLMGKVCPLCEAMRKITPAALALIDELTSQYRDELLVRAMTIAAKKGFPDVSPEAVRYAEAEYIDEVVKERMADWEDYDE